MKAPPFAYARAASPEEALALLREAGDEAKLLAGGQSLVPLLAYRLLRPSHLIDVDGLDQLAGFDRDTERLRIGALTRHEALARADLDGGERLLAEAAAHIGHLPIRTRGTLGGSVAHADPAAELPVALLALDAVVVARSVQAERRIAAADLFLGPFTTALAADEAVVAVEVPATVRAARAAFTELAVRAGDFALASAGVVARVGDGRLRDVRIALGGVDATPVRATRAEALLEAEEPADEAIREAGQVAATDCDPAEDASTSVEYRRTLVTRLVRDALTRIRDEGDA
jgi:carbon-monoxide dehydrogenase medium subunit/6-hydroxypseudooxynicotine dehydrogenase subunit alpha